MAADQTVPPQDGGQMQALIQSFMMIIVSEIGDKTFLIAAILAMRHPRMTVFAGAFGSLVVMSMLSAALGHLLPTLIPKKWTQTLAALLFIVFGLKMLQEGREMKAGNDKIREEMKEAEEEIDEDDTVRDSIAPGNGRVSIPLEELEEGSGAPRHSRTRSQNVNHKGTFMDKARRHCSMALGPVFTQAFILTFLGEWGDRSQISTIALGAAHNVYLVTIGVIIGHGCCTALAVVGGRYVSTKISVKHVTLAGSGLFLLFGLIYLYEAFFASVDIVDPADISYHP